MCTSTRCENVHFIFIPRQSRRASKWCLCLFNRLCQQYWGSRKSINYNNIKKWIFPIKGRETHLTKSLVMLNFQGSPFSLSRREESLFLRSLKTIFYNFLGQRNFLAFWWDSCPVMQLWLSSRIFLHYCRCDHSRMCKIRWRSSQTLWNSFGVEPTYGDYVFPC